MAGIGSRRSASPRPLASPRPSRVAQTQDHPGVRRGRSER